MSRADANECSSTVKSLFNDIKQLNKSINTEAENILLISDNNKNLNVKGQTNLNNNQSLPITSIDDLKANYPHNALESPFKAEARKIIMGNYFSISRVGLEDDGNEKENNQDSLFCELKAPDYLLAGVCDGHGENGHLVSQLLTSKLNERLDNIFSESTEISKEAIKSGIESNFKAMHRLLVEESGIDIDYSGTTSCSVIVRGDKLICANLGDSRAIIGRKVNNKVWEAVTLSRDHKPTEKDEARRIAISGGRIEQMQDDDTGEFVGPMRIWKSDEDVPGLAMTRSFGDRIASKLVLYRNQRLAILT